MRGAGRAFFTTAVKIHPGGGHYIKAYVRDQASLRSLADLLETLPAVKKANIFAVGKIRIT
ncbi:hypothetical protein [Chitinophaga parva]|nr:hypothetical protein [Chitinophaga parva]